MTMLRDEFIDNESELIECRGETINWIQLASVAVGAAMVATAPWLEQKPALVVGVSGLTIIIGSVLAVK